MPRILNRLQFSQLQLCPIAYLFESVISNKDVTQIFFCCSEFCTPVKAMQRGLGNKALLAEAFQLGRTGNNRSFLNLGMGSHFLVDLI